MILTEFREYLNQHELVLAYCSTPTCNVCKVLKPKVIDLINELGSWDSHYIDTTQSPEIAGQHLVFTVPTLILFVQGREVQRFSRHFGLDALEQELRKYKELVA